MDAFIVIAFVLLGPALVIGALAALIAKLGGHNASKVFWVTALIVVGIEIIGWGLCVASLQIG